MSTIRVLHECNLRWWGPPGLGGAATSWIVFTDPDVLPLRIALFLLFGVTGILAMFFVPSYRIWLEDGRLCWEARSWRVNTQGNVRVSDIARLLNHTEEAEGDEDAGVVLETYEGEQFHLPQRLLVGFDGLSQAGGLLVALRSINPRILQVSYKTPAHAAEDALAA